MTESENSVKVNKKRTYLKAVENSIGTKIFKHMYASVNGGPETDILKNGELSCAYYVSSLLVIFGLIDEVHTTVDSTVKELKKAGWSEVSQIESAEPGSVMVWEGVEYSDGEHKHIGFYLGDDQAVSNSWKEGVPKAHHITSGEDDGGEPNREIEKVFSLEI